MRIAYKECNFRPKSRELIEQCNAIIARYDMALTLRQLYYRLVAATIIPNTPRSYDNLGALINDARLAGLVDWDAIQDRTRNLRKLSSWNDPADVIASAHSSYHVDWWEGQRVRVEVWIEKDALVGVIEAICEEWDTPYFSCRGYTSQSEMWGAAMRMIRRKRDHKQDTVILHLGDHDPSGLDMTRDIDDRLRMFCTHHGHREPIVNRIALTIEQVEQYSLPENPAKVTDSRAQAYILEHGESSWELDALEPDVITNLIGTHIAEQVDMELFNARKSQEERDKDLLSQASDRWEEVVEHLEAT